MVMDNVLQQVPMFNRCHLEDRDMSGDQNRFSSEKGSDLHLLVQLDVYDTSCIPLVCVLFLTNLKMCFQLQGGADALLLTV